MSASSATNGPRDAAQAVRLHTLPGAPGVTVVRAVVCANTFPRHTHRSFVIGAVTSGMRAIDTGPASSGSAHLCAEADHLFLLNPNQPHCCAIVPGAMHEYCALCVPIERMEQAAYTAWNAPSRPRFDRAAAYDPELVRRVADFGLAVARGAADAAMLDELLAAVTARHARPLPGPVPSPHPAALRARDALLRDAQGPTPLPGVAFADLPAPRLTLEELAHRAYLSPFHLHRVFSREFGVSPRRYQEQERVRMALELLLAGASIAETAQRAGFADQSHFTRVFRGLMGVPPGRFLRTARSGERADQSTTAELEGVHNGRITDTHA